MNRCPTARVEEVREDRQMGRRGRRLREGESGSVKGWGLQRGCADLSRMPRDASA